MTSNTPCSFLFVVNQLHICLEPDDDGVVPEQDSWGNVHPPTRRGAYHNEYASPVLRYSNGRCYRAEGYHWNRPEGWGNQGLIEGRQNYRDPTPYRYCTIFFCNPHLPIVVTGADATSRRTLVPGQYDNADDDDDNDDEDTDGEALEPSLWHMLRFYHPERGNPARGVSQATVGGGGHAYVAGRNPGWIPNLVPSTFKHPREHHADDPAAGERPPPRSRGLGGELPVVLGLMTFAAGGGGVSDHQSAVSRAFLGHNAYWRGGTWHTTRVPRYPGPDETPRGYYVHVCLDDVDNPTGSTHDHLLDFETRNGIIVRD